MPEASTMRETVITISPHGSVESSPHIAVQAWHGAGHGVIDLADGGWPRLQALTWSAVSLAIRVPVGCRATAAEVRRCAQMMRATEQTLTDL